ncbi:hypothetical protein [Ancylobacter pratisalsi]|uniref:Uncharacterized protein n=1 Tax=Ancylobacter pratisalsi TaxID=1745854 RepID=A0A6P1YJU4_9HYPH|nr:hypothetical protein [Ancylobacter pratisalsi]QIB33240.1 hypothetical protein G3A50_05590 [Ancylobacter pratisalsi]
MNLEDRTLNLEDHILSIVSRSRGGLTAESVAMAYAKDMENEIRSILDRLSRDGAINKNRGTGADNATYHKLVATRRP